jgi:choline dehydrogenase
LSARIVEAAGHSPIGRTDDYNGPAPSGIGAAQIFYRDGRRSGSAAAYLTAARRRPNLHIMTNVTAQQLLFEGHRAVGVRYRNGDATAEARAREVILSAGAIGTPQLMELSGLGQAGHLRSLGIGCVHHLPAVGEHLQDHYLVFVVQALKGIRGLGAELSGWRSWVNGALYLLFKRGYMNGTPTQVNGHGNVRVNGADVGVQFMGIPLSFDYDLKRKTITRNSAPALMLGANVCRPNARGHVHIRSPRLEDKPRIVANFMTDAQDVGATVAGLKMCREILAQRSLDDIRSIEKAPGAAMQSDTELENYARAAGASAYHPVGTCRMGLDPATSVVDSRLRVHGIAGLRIVDASIMPSIVSANTHIPTVMIAEKAADLIKSAE